MPKKKPRKRIKRPFNVSIYLENFQLDGVMAYTATEAFKKAIAKLARRPLRRLIDKKNSSSTKF